MFAQYHKDNGDNLPPSSDHQPQETGLGARFAISCSVVKCASISLPWAFTLAERLVLSYVRRALNYHQI